jgi:acetyl/propionyl-CoA carboxylase alpha subunit
VNRRIQVEHPVTEAVFGLDVVEWQLRVAAGEPLPPEGAWTPRGHAIEARVCAEDPERSFLPSPGRVLRFRAPGGEGIRVDAALGVRGEVPPFYDSLVAKVVAHAETRDAAIARLDAALADTALVGVASNVPFLRRVLAEPDFRAVRWSVDSLDARMGAWPADEPPTRDAALAAVAAEFLGVGGEGDATDARGRRARPDPWRALSGWRVRAEARP